MTKKLAKKKNKKLLLIWLVGFFILSFLAFYILYPYITLFLPLNGSPYPTPDKHSGVSSNLHSTLTSKNIRVQSLPTNTPTLSSNMNSKLPFYGENIDMSQILPASQHYVINSQGEDLIDIAARLGINLIRVTNAERSFDNNADSTYTVDQWDQVLNKMQSKGIKALILIEVAGNNSDYYTPDLRPAYFHMVQEFLDSGVFSHPDVYGVDIKNEPVLTDANLSMLQQAHNMIKAKYPNLKQTIGWWATPEKPDDPYNPNYNNWLDFSAGQKVANMVDFYSTHMYWPDLSTDGLGLSLDLRTKLFLSQVEQGLQTEKPILIEEFGEANGDSVSDQDTIGSPQLQANVYQGVYQAIKEINKSQILGSVAFDFYSRNQYPDSWAIVKNNGNYLFPAAYILQKYALGKNTSSPPASMNDTSQSYLLKIADNGTTKNLHVSDRIGLELQLDSKKNYSLSLSRNNILQPVELLHYDPVSNAYLAVYQATGKGNVQLNITPACSTKTTCVLSSPVYTLTITTQ